MQCAWPVALCQCGVCSIFEPEPKIQPGAEGDEKAGDQEEISGVKWAVRGDLISLCSHFKLYINSIVDVVSDIGTTTFG